jgi:predicted NBD/HSP70 family sugar kinase
MCNAGDGLVIGVDVGGTKVAAGFVDSTGRISQQVRHPMVADGDAARGFAAVKATIDALLALDLKQKVHGINPGARATDPMRASINPPTSLLA